MPRPLAAAVLLLAILAGIWRFVDLERDPDIVTESSQEAWSDPAWYLYNARSHALFGEWRPDEGGALYVAQGYSFLACLWLSVFGVSYLNAVWLATLAGFVVIAGTVFFAAASARGDPSISTRDASAAAAISLLASYILFAHQHVPNGDMEALAVSTISAFCLARLASVDSSRERMKFRLLSLLSGVGIAVAPFIKLHNGIFSAAALAAWLAGYLILGSGWKSKWREATPWLALGLGIGACAWLSWAAWLYATPGNQMAAQFGRLRMFAVASAPANNVFSRSTFEVTRFFQSNLLYRQPFEAVLAALGLFVFSFGPRRNWPLFLASVWWLTGIAAIMNMTVDPLRYRLIVWPAIVVLAAHFWATLFRRNYRPLSGTGLHVTAIGIAILMASVATYLANFKLHGVMTQRFQLLFFLVSIGLAYLMLAALRRVPQTVTAGFLAIALMAWSIPQWRSGERSVTHELLNASHEFEKYPPNYVLGGVWAVRLAFSTPRNTYFFWTPPAMDRVNLIADNSDTIVDSPVRWHELERHRLQRSAIDIEITFGQVDR